MREFRNPFKIFSPAKPKVRAAVQTVTTSAPPATTGDGDTAPSKKKKKTRGVSTQRTTLLTGGATQGVETQRRSLLGGGV